ncbi:hypothetical protein AVEN_167919-1 [Araneus ventricosus]|uniref:Uncharacterized protein n=1 Tax=Araneus ventricosus TaxID=182803 RepID=A0A4Y2FYG0_ARAVE|nr:hypothetical protein AVEN_167919-1 [Araneus ventricosus]
MEVFLVTAFGELGHFLGLHLEHLGISLVCIWSQSCNLNIFFCGKQNEFIVLPGHDGREFVAPLNTSGDFEYSLHRNFPPAPITKRPRLFFHVFVIVVVVAAEMMFEMVEKMKIARHKVGAVEVQTSQQDSSSSGHRGLALSWIVGSWIFVNLIQH